MLAWLDGQLLESPEQPAIGVLDHGIIVGDGVFETIKIEAGAPFALTRHLDRLVRSAEGLGIGKPDVSAICEGIDATLEGQDLPFGRIRVTVTSGPGPRGSPRGNHGLTAVVIAEPCDRPPPVSSIITVPWPRNERGALSGLKTTSYAENAKMVEAAIAKGASEAVMPNTAGLLCEGTGANVFYVVDDELRTPSLASGCLAGVTRALVIEWSGAREVDEPLADVLGSASEAFLASTMRDVQAIARWDDRALPAPGPVTKACAETWAARAAETMDP